MAHGIMLDPSQRKTRELYNGPPCPHFPHKYKTEAAHQAKLASRRRSHHRFQKTSVDYRLKAILGTIRHRCESPKFIGWRWYGAKGIKNFLTLRDLKKLWERDNAAAMRKPSIDRIDHNGNYELSNVRFMELAENVRRGTSGPHAKPIMKRNKNTHAPNTTRIEAKP